MTFENRTASTIASNASSRNKSSKQKYMFVKSKLVSQKNQTGFTLIELIVAITVLSVLSVIGYKAFNSAIATRHSIAEHSAMLRDFELGLFILQNDFEQMQIDPIPLNTLAFTGNKVNYNNSKSDSLKKPNETSDIMEEIAINNKNSNKKMLFSFYRSENPALNIGISRISYYFKNNELIQSQTYLSNPNLFMQIANHNNIDPNSKQDNQNINLKKDLYFNQPSSDNKSDEHSILTANDRNRFTNETVIMKNISNLEINYYNKSNKKFDIWTQNITPSEIEIIFTHARYGKIIFKQMLSNY